jgi:hypothetical protein
MANVFTMKKFILSLILMTFATQIVALPAFAQEAMDFSQLTRDQQMAIRNIRMNSFYEDLRNKAVYQQTIATCRGTTAERFGANMINSGGIILQSALDPLLSIFELINDPTALAKLWHRRFTSERLQNTLNSEAFYLAVRDCYPNDEAAQKTVIYGMVVYSEVVGKVVTALAVAVAWEVLMGEGTSIPIFLVERYPGIASLLIRLGKLVKFSGTVATVVGTGLGSYGIGTALYGLTPWAKKDKEIEIENNNTELDKMGDDYTKWAIADSRRTIELEKLRLEELEPNSDEYKESVMKIKEYELVELNLRLSLNKHQPGF